MSTHPTIAALKARLESEINRVAKDTFGREYSKWNKEQKRPFNYDESFRHGHEAATERLMGVIEKAVEMATFYSLKSNYIVRDEGRNYDTDNVVYELDENTYADVELGTRAREFITTLADASGESEKDGK